MLANFIRCLTLADTLSQRGWQCDFAVREETVQAVRALSESEHHVLTLPRPSADHLVLMRQTWSVGVRLLVVDDYKFDAKFEGAARPWADKVLVIDDLANRSHDADLLVDRSSGSVQQRYDELVPTACEVLCGSSYALIRAE